MRTRRRGIVELVEENSRDDKDADTGEREPAKHIRNAVRYGRNRIVEGVESKALANARMIVGRHRRAFSSIDSGLLRMRQCYFPLQHVVSSPTSFDFMTGKKGTPPLGVRQTDAAAGERIALSRVKYGVQFEWDHFARASTRKETTMMKTFAKLGLRTVLHALVAIPLTVSAQTGQPQPHRHPSNLDADQHFLRDLADHNEAMVYLAHSAMQLKHAHAGGDEAGATDVAEDARKTEIAKVLKTLFKDETGPQVPPLLRQQVDSILRLQGEAYEAAVRSFTLNHHRAAVDMIDHGKPRRTSVRTLAKRIRAQYVREMTKVGSTAAR